VRGLTAIQIGGTTQKTTQKILDIIAANLSISRKELATQSGLPQMGSNTIWPTCIRMGD
jgi:hypothetical protein